MVVLPIVNASKPAVCTCPKVKCPRHGDCGPCRAYHFNMRHPRPPRCERKQTWLSRLFGAW